MSKVKVRMNSRGAVGLMNSSEIQNDLLNRAQRIKSQADTFGSGVYVADVRPGKTRAHAMVKTSDPRSIVSNAKHNTLLKSLDVGR